jgi:hypothetical protein
MTVLERYFKIKCSGLKHIARAALTLLNWALRSIGT